MRDAGATSKAELAELMVGRRVDAPGATAAAHTVASTALLVGATILPRASTLAARELLGRCAARSSPSPASPATARRRSPTRCAALLAPDARRRSASTGARLPATPRACVAAGVARIPEDRHAVGVIGDLADLGERDLRALSRAARSRALGWLRRRAAQRMHAQRIVEHFDVRGAGLDAPARSLSGGNMQKLILGRALRRREPPPCIVANQPTWGLDIGAVAYVHRSCSTRARRGAAVLLISEDLDEMFALADRIAVMYHGRLSRRGRRQAWTLGEIGLAMAGVEAAHA